MERVPEASCIDFKESGDFLSLAELPESPTSLNTSSKDGKQSLRSSSSKSPSLPLIPIINSKRSKKTSNHTREMFSHFSLTMDKETAKYMPYDNVAFPKLVDKNVDKRAAALPAMESLWMVGFLDHEVRNEKESTLRDIAHFVSLPGGKLLPGAATEIRKIYNKERNKVSDRDKKFKGLTEGQKRRVLGKTTIAPRLPDELVMRLKELGKTRGGKTIRKKDFSPTSAQMRKSILKRRKHRKRQFEKVYRMENDKIRKALRQRRPIMQKPAIRSRAIEDLYELEREQTEAVMRIQKCYKSYKIRMYWKSIVVKSKATVIIQRYVRGMITRTLVRVWLLRRSWLVIIAQSVFRGNRSRIRTKAMKYEMLRSVNIIQRNIRGKLSRIRVNEIKRCNAATKIQTLWRGCTNRIKVDRIWLSNEVIKMQKLVRGHIGRMFAQNWKSEAVGSAVILQKTVRGMFSRMILAQELWERETTRQKDYLKLLRAEDQYLTERIAEMERMISKSKLKEKLKAAKQRYEEVEDVVFEKEWDYLALKRERIRVDPLGVRQGWSEELDKYIVENRQWVTNAKFEFLFIDAFRYKQREQNYEKVMQELEELKWQREKIQEWRELELEKLFTRENDHKWKRQRKNRLIKIADQKRIWKVSFYTWDGKIDKRRHKKAWSDHHETFNIGSVDLFAQTQQAEAARMMGGSDKKTSFEIAVDKVALQNSQNQMLQYGAMFKPLFEGMESMAEAVAQFSLRNQLKRQTMEEEED